MVILVYQRVPHIFRMAFSHFQDQDSGRLSNARWLRIWGEPRLRSSPRYWLVYVNVC